MAPRAAQLSRFLEPADATVKVEVSTARGSTPREAGTWMLVSTDDIFATIGGGRLEMMAIDEARSMLSGGRATGSITVPLGPEIGQCCGGNVTLTLSRMDADSAAALIAEQANQDSILPEAYIFGAGHVGKALARALSPLPLNTVLVETRKEELAKATPDVDRRLAAMPETLIETAGDGAAYVVLTHDHALDFLIVQTALARKDAAYVGMIGSKTKRASFARWYSREAGGKRQDLDRLVCPIGGTVRDKRPEVIAALAAAEIMTALVAH